MFNIQSGIDLVKSKSLWGCFVKYKSVHYVQWSESEPNNLERIDKGSCSYVRPDAD